MQYVDEVNLRHDNPGDLLLDAAALGTSDVEREGVSRTGNVGERVDPARHDVLATEAADGVEPGCVSRVIQPGYLLGEKVLRFAKVCVQPAA